MITVAQFLDGVRKNVARVDRYELGQDGRNGACDCIGLIIGALRLMGETWNGTHGSNYAARNEMRSVRRIQDVHILAVGDIVYKAKAPGDDDYALPSRYDAHPDRLDYYHVGVVTGISPLEITHCTGVQGGIKKDTVLGSWEFFGRLKKVSEDDVEMTEPQEYMVVGGRLKMRNAPSGDGAVIQYIPNGAIVTGQVLFHDAEWSFCSYDGKSGYCMTNFLQEVECKNETQAGITLTEKQYSELLQYVSAIEKILDNVGK